MNLSQILSAALLVAVPIAILISWARYTHNARLAAMAEHDRDTRWALYPHTTEEREVTISDCGTEYTARISITEQQLSPPAPFYEPRTSQLGSYATRLKSFKRANP